MADVAVAAPGKPIWVDLGTPDVDASIKFYGELFGWKADDAVEGFGGYRVLRKDGKQVAGVAPLMSEQQPPAWMVYIGSDDAKAITEKVKQAGGNVIVEPMEIGETGSMAVYQDSTGAAIGVWQPNQMKGSDIYDQPGSMSYSELYTGDVEKAKQFYKQVFGWDSKTEDMGGQPYTMFSLGGQSITGTMQTENMPPNWHEYFAVADCKESTEKAKQLGAKVMVDCTEIPAGIFSILGDPNGAVFGLIQNK
jgi:predicted enzyme related to lactoylglutathione lyase